MNTEAIVFVVDAEGKSRSRLAMQLRGLGYEVNAYASAEEFLDCYRGHRPGCLVLNTELHGMTELELLDQMAVTEISLAVICMATSHDVATAVRVLKGGAVDFLVKPCAREALAKAVIRAIDIDRHRHAAEQRKTEIRDRFNTLTPDECRVLQMLLDGMPGKRIARALDVSPRTVDFRRASLLQKLKAGSFFELCQLVTLANLGRMDELARVGCQTAADQLRSSDDRERTPQSSARPSKSVGNSGS